MIFHRLASRLFCGGSQLVAAIFPPGFNSALCLGATVHVFIRGAFGSAVAAIKSVFPAVNAVLGQIAFPICMAAVDAIFGAIRAVLYSVPETQRGCLGG